MDIERYARQTRAVEGLFAKAVGTMMPGFNLRSDQDFDTVMRNLYLKSDDAIYQKLQEVLRNPPLDAWVIEVSWEIAFGHFNSTTQGKTRRSVADFIAGTPFQEAYRRVCKPVPSDHIRVVVVMPIKTWFWIVDRPIRWRAPRDDNDNIIIEEAPLIVGASAIDVARYAGYVEQTSDPTPDAGSAEAAVDHAQEPSTEATPVVEQPGSPSADADKLQE